MIPINCYRVAKIYSGEGMELLSGPKRALMRLHLALCPQCRRYVLQMKLLGKAARLEAETLDPSSVDDLIKRLVARLTGP